MRDWNVLIVEDDRAVAETHRRAILRQPGFVPVAIAETAEEAATLLRRGVRVDLIILDVSLPGTDGATLLRALRASGSHADAIAVTAVRDPEVVRDLVQHGVVDLLVKPFALERLQEALVRFRTRRRTLDRARLDQGDIDVIRSATVAPLLPKGLSGETLVRVRTALVKAGAGATSEDIAKRAAVARVTARRYLEYLVTVGQAGAEDVPAGPGRPRRRYTPAAALLQ